ncbi:MAG: hypothetical protein ACE5MB_08985, partial [Anaerolineae bacterium]
QRIDESKEYLEEAIRHNSQRIDESKEYLEEAIRHNSQRIDELRESNAQRFQQMDQRFERIEVELHRVNNNIRNWIIAGISILGILITALNFLR